MELVKEPRHLVVCEDCGHIWSGAKHADRLDGFDEAIRLNKKSVECPDCGEKIWVVRP